MHPTPQPRRRARSIAAAAIAVTTAVITALALDTADASAASFVVRNLASSGEGSLSDRIADANAAAGPDVITFAPGLSGTIAHQGTTLITDDLTIVGPGPDRITLTSAGGTGLHADQADLHLSGITSAPPSAAASS